MHEVGFSILPIRCRLSDLAAIAQPADEATSVLAVEQAFTLAVTVEFLGAGAIALLRLQPQICVEFYAKPAIAGETLGLGLVREGAIASTSIYRLEHLIESPRAAGLAPGTVYHIGALLRVGALEGPALIAGVHEALMVEMYALESVAPKGAEAMSTDDLQDKARNNKKRVLQT
ncbi:MAG: hypothetical protein VKK04_00580 [Synechococcales bacterium]|nr:hypothetical protein [Synechococcales bacterium]